MATPARSAADFLPARLTLPALQRAAAGCRGCELYRRATQTVFGEGPRRARLVLVGEQPGDKEDIAGRPFVGPAGLLLNRALEHAGIPRDAVYVTNAVKHFKWSARGKRRLHQRPREGEIDACYPWLEAELHVLKPAAVVCLGATAARAVRQNGTHQGSARPSNAKSLERADVCHGAPGGDLAPDRWRGAGACLCAVRHRINYRLAGGFVQTR